MVNSAKENHEIAQGRKEYERTYVYHQILKLIDDESLSGNFSLTIEPRGIAVGCHEHDEMFKCLKNTPAFVKYLQHMGYWVDFIKLTPDSNYEYIKISW